MVDRKARERGDLSDFTEIVPRDIQPGDRFTKITPKYRDFSGLDLRGVRFYYSDLRWCDFTDCNLDDAHICWCYTDGSLFQNISARRMTYRSTKSRECLFQWCNFRGTDFHHSRFNSTNFRNCDLRNTSWQVTEIDETFYVDCDLEVTDFCDSDIAVTNLTEFLETQDIKVAGTNLDLWGIRSYTKQHSQT